MKLSKCRLLILGYILMIKPVYSQIENDLINPASDDNTFPSLDVKESPDNSANNDMAPKEIIIIDDLTTQKNVPFTTGDAVHEIQFQENNEITAAPSIAAAAEEPVLTPSGSEHTTSGSSDIFTDSTTEVLPLMGKSIFKRFPSPPKEKLATVTTLTSDIVDTTTVAIDSLQEQTTHRIILAEDHTRELSEPSVANQMTFTGIPLSPINNVAPENTEKSPYIAEPSSENPIDNSIPLSPVEDSSSLNPEFSEMSNVLLAMPKDRIKSIPLPPIAESSSVESTTSNSAWSEEKTTSGVIIIDDPTPETAVFKIINKNILENVLLPPIIEEDLTTISPEMVQKTDDVNSATYDFTTEKRVLLPINDELLRIIPLAPKLMKDNSENIESTTAYIENMAQKITGVIIIDDPTTETSILSLMINKLSVTEDFITQKTPEIVENSTIDNGKAISSKNEEFDKNNPNILTSMLEDFISTAIPKTIEDSLTILPGSTMSENLGGTNDLPVLLTTIESISKSTLEETTFSSEPVMTGVNLGGLNQSPPSTVTLETIDDGQIINSVSATTEMNAIKGQQTELSLKDATIITSETSDELTVISDVLRIKYSSSDVSMTLNDTTPSTEEDDGRLPIPHTIW